MTDFLIKEFKEKLAKTIEFTKGEIINVRSGRVSPSLVEGLVIDAYAGQMKMKLMELAAVTSEGPSTLLITPFDPSVIKDIEKGILTSSLHISPRVEGKLIYLSFPPLSQEQRRALVKIVHQKIEEGKIKLRGHRDEVRRKIKTSFEQKNLSEDQKFQLEKKIDEVAHEYGESLNELMNKKEKEILAV